MKTYYEIKEKYKYLSITFNIFIGGKNIIQTNLNNEQTKEGQIINGGCLELEGKLFYLPDMNISCNSPLLLEEYLERVLEDKYTTTNLLLFYDNYPQYANIKLEEYAYKHGAYFLPIGFYAYHEISGNDIYYIQVHEDYGGTIRQAITLYHDGKKFLEKPCEETDWMKLFRRRYNLYANPANAHLLDKMPFIKRSDSPYYSKDLFLDIKWFIKMGESWVMVDKIWLEDNLDGLPEEIKNQFLLRENMA